jgi:hypothetical protein
VSHFSGKQGLLTRKGKMIINSLTILIVAGICLANYVAYRLGQENGYDQGYCEGRKFMRKFYEEAGR